MTGRGGSVWTRPDVRAALSRLPAGSAALSFQDLATSARTAFEALAALSAAGAEVVDYCEPTAIPSQEVLERYLGPVVTGVYRGGNSLVFRIRALPPGVVAR
jgi:hypothetical protein